MSGKDGLVFFDSFKGDFDNENFLTHLVGISSDIIFIIDLHGQIAGFSPMANEALGYSPEGLDGKGIDIFFDEGDTFFGPLMEKLRSEKKIMDLNAVWKDAEGGEIIVSTSFSLIEDRKGEPRAVMIVARDITREKLAQREIRKYIEKINDYVVQIESSNFMKDLFADIIRHDLLGPITIIRNTLDLMDLEGDKLSLISRNVEKTASILEVAMRYSKLENVEGIDFRSVSLKDIIGEVMLQNEKFADARDMKIRNFCHGDIFIRADSSLFEDAIGNIISNAVKYSKEHTNIDILTEERDDVVSIKVIDYGYGVPDQFKETIFQRFQRGKRQGVKGTGMGLAIVKRIVELHGGRVWVEDNEDGGAVFIIEVPKSQG